MKRLVEDTSEAPPRTGFRTIKFLGLPLLAFAVALEAGQHPLIRFDDELADVVVETFPYFLPFATLVFALIIPQHPVTKVAAFVFMLPLLAVSSLMLGLGADSISKAYKTGTDPDFERVTTVAIERYSIGLYRKGGGVFSSPVIYVLEQKKILPGILLVRVISVIGPAYTATCKLIGKDTVQIVVPPHIDVDAEYTTRTETETYKLNPYF
jgi:hypothetical protein